MKPDMRHVLIVDDETNSAQALSALVQEQGYSTAVASSLREARQQLMLMPAQAVILDLHLPDGNGFSLLEDAALVAGAEIILVTGHASIESSVRALRLGAVDYLVKPVQPAQLKQVLQRLGQGREVRADIQKRAAEVPQSGQFGRLIGESAAMQRVYAQIARVAPTAVNVFIVGESGTGKELVAQTLHELSRRRRAPLLSVNCGAISAQLIESELFGHEKGSFTGASRQHRGYFERADGGTLFLDEITEMPMDLQVKLLRVLETGAFTRVGSEDPIQTDVRILAATNRNPHEAVSAGRLREDLFYRLDVFEIALPALRARAGDATLLAKTFLREVNELEGLELSFSEGALKALETYSWPGNVRELRNVVCRSALMADGKRIEELALPEVPNTAAHAVGNGTLKSSVGSTIAQAERDLILATLEHCHGLREPTAEMLGISLKTLYNRLRDYGQSPA
ncbi:MAG: sigma-54-dependent transcriptional regulator [Burkholderiales bacterium]|jgi:two-component system response regulator AtoC